MALPRSRRGAGRRTTTGPDDAVALVFSLSSAAPLPFGARLRDVEADLRRVLRDASPAGRFSEQIRGLALDVWRPVTRRAG